MPETFVVEVNYVPPVLSPEAVEELAEKFKTSPEKMEGLLEHLPGVVTKPVSQGEARVIAGYFERAGLTTEVKSNKPETSPDRATLTPRKPDLRQARPTQQAKPVAHSAKKTEAKTKPQKATPPPDLKIDLSEFAKPLRSAVTESPGQDLSAFSNQRTGRATRRKENVKKIYAVAPPSEAKRSGSLRRKLVRALFLSTLIAAAGSFLVVVAYQWFGLQDRAFDSAALATQSSANSLSRVVEATGDVSQFTGLPSPVPEQRQLTSQFVISLSASGNILARWPSSFELSESLQERVLSQGEQSLLRAGTNQISFEANDALNPFGSRLILTSHPLEHGNALVGSVITGYTYKPLILQFRNDLITVALLALLPLALAFLLGLLIIRRLTRSLFDLIDRADSVSKGRLEEPIRIQSDDELRDLGASLERLRVSTQASLDRLRERRDTSF